MTPQRFERIRAGQLDVLVRPELRASLMPIVESAARGWQPAPAATTIEPVTGGRGAGVRIDAPSGRFAVRAGRRGGLPGRLLTTVYFGAEPRPFREARVSAELYARGAPVVEVCAAAARWLAPGMYRSWLVSRWVEDAETLWRWAQRERDADRRQRVYTALGRAVRRLHAAGARHPDLNANNILVVAPAAAQEPSIVLIDFDGARLARGAVAHGERDLERLRRSAHKLDPAGRAIRAADLQCIEAAYG